MILPRLQARRVVAHHYPGLKFRIGPHVTLGVRPRYEVVLGKVQLAWQSLCAGSDSAVRIGTLRPDHTVDWQADVTIPADPPSERR
jgi:hypothetical protein